MGHPLDWVLAICLLARCTANCAPGQCVEYNGHLYRTLDGTHPDVTSAGCQEVYLPMLDGWALSGYSADSRHVGTSYPWGTHVLVHSTTSGECSRTTLLPGDCGNWRVLVSGATYMPPGCHGRVLITQPTTTTTTTTTATTSTFTTTTVTTTTTTTVTCITGSGRNAEGGCSPCPAGHMADAGASSCLPTLAYAVSSLDTPNLSLDADHGFVRGVVHVTPLPSPLYEAVALQYSIDAGTNASNFSMQSSCSLRWTAVNSSHIVAALPYSSLDEDCPLNTSVEGGEVHRRGTFGVLLGYRLAGGGSITPVMQWLFPQRLRFPGLVQAVHSHLLVTEHSGHAETDVHGPTFEASLALFESDAFTTLKRIPAYHKHDVVHAAISLVQKLNFDLRVTSAWLSKFADPSAPAEHNISASVQAIGAMGPKGQGFSAVLETCVGCYIHAEAELALPSGDTRRLHIVPSASAFTEISVREAPVDTDPMDRSPSGPSNPDLPLAPPTCLLVAAATAFFFSMLTRLAISVSGQRQRFAGFACVEFVDVITDIVVYIACRGEGDFRFDNDENGLLATALLTSTSLNMGLLTLELALFFFGPKCLGYGLPAIAVPWLACIHLMLEDCFQLVLYALVSGGQATEGLGQRPAVVLAVVQSGLFILWKVKDAVDWEEIVNKSAYRTRVAADDWES